MFTYSDYPTPYLLVDLARAEENIRAFAALAKAHGKALRPHIKTHRMAYLAQMQMRHGACGITCAKVTEAQVMADAGIEDIFIAYSFVGEHRVRHAIQLAQRVRLILGVDCYQGAAWLSEAAAALPRPLEVRLDIDTGLGRTGAGLAECASLAKAVAALPNLAVEGIFTYKSANLDGATTLDTLAAAQQEDAFMAKAQAAIQAAGVPLETVSGGSTPTGKHLASLTTLNELRPGTYIFNDMGEVGYGASTLETCAAGVVATVISIPKPDVAILDAGSKALCPDAVLGRPPHHFPGHGLVVGHEHLIYDRQYEEHGILRTPDGKPTGLSLGQQVLIIPNHICTTVSLYDQAVLRHPDGTATMTRVNARGCSQ